MAAGALVRQANVSTAPLRRHPLTSSQTLTPYIDFRYWKFWLSSSLHVALHVRFIFTLRFPIIEVALAAAAARVPK